MSVRDESAALARFLDRLRLQLGAARAAAALLRLATVAAVALVLNCLFLDRLPARPWAAFALTVAGTAATAVAAVRLALALRRPSRRAAALRAQSVDPALRNDVESSLELAPLLDAPSPTISASLVGALVGTTGARLEAVAVRRFVSWRPVRSAALLLAAAAAPLVAFALSGGIAPTAVRALVDPSAAWPLGRVRLVVEPGDARVARGSDLTVRVRAEGTRPAEVAVEYSGAAGEGSAAAAFDRQGSWSWRFVAVPGDFTYRAVASGGAATPWHRVQVVDAPAAGNFAMRYTYPAYSGLATRTTSGSGEIEALKGTSVEVSFATSSPVAKASIVLGANRLPVGLTGEGRRSAALYLNGETSYRVELEDAGGITNGDGQQFPVRYLPDAPPTVEITEPAGEVEGDPLGTVAIRYRAADDYGLSKLALVARSSAGERRAPLPLLAGARGAGDEHLFELAPLRAEPGEVVAVHVEAADNDTISGPKVGVSAPILVRIADPRVKREETREEMERLADDLLQLLGEELDLQSRYEQLEQKAGSEEQFPWSEAAEAAALQKTARESAARAEERAARIAEAMDRDAAAADESVFQADLIREGLGELRERQQAPMEQMAEAMDPSGGREDARDKAAFLADAAARAARKAEQLALMADALKRESGMADAGRQAQQMAGAEDRILDALERMSPGDRAAAEQVLEELARIEQALRDLAEALQRQGQELPEEFLNSDAIENLDLQGVLDQLERVRQLLKKGDIEGARRAARELARQLADLRNRLEQAEEEVNELARQALERLRRSTVPRLQQLAERQQQLLDRTESLEAQAGPRLDAALRELAASEAATPPPAEADVLRPDERGRAEAMAREQEGLRQEAGRLAAEVDAIRAALPFLPAEVGADLAEAGGLMGEAGGQLARLEPRRALPPERGALAALRRASERAQQSLDDLSQMQQMRQGQSGGGMGLGLPMFRRPGGSSDDPTRSRRSGGRRGMDVRDFQIPGRQEHRVPKVFREEIMKSLQDGFPPSYEERIKDYYQRIAE